MDNRAAEESGWDDSLLVAELDELLALDFDLAYAGFEEDLDELLASGEALGLAGHGADDGDELPAVEAFPVSRPGDLWVCGPHRVLCGNATVDDDVARAARIRDAGDVPHRPALQRRHRQGLEPQAPPAPRPGERRPSRNRLRCSSSNGWRNCWPNG